VSGPRTAIYAGLIGLTVAILSETLGAGVDKDQRSDEQRRTDKTDNRLTASEPKKIRLELPIKLFDQAWTTDRLLRSDPVRASLDNKPISNVRLLDSNYLAADWRNGRVQYRLKSVNPWGASVGGQLSTSTAKVTFTWSFDD
jgi:hypothetical protein